MKKRRPPPSFDTSPGAVAIQGSRTTASSDTSPGAVVIQGLGNLRMSTETSEEIVRVHEEECKEEVTVGGTGSVDMNGSNAPEVRATQRQNLAQEDLPVGEPIYAELHTPYTQEPKKWHERPFYRAILVGGCLLALLVAVGIVLLVVLVALPRPKGETSPPTFPPSATTPTSPPVTLSPTAIPTSSMTSEEIACEFIGRPSLDECRNTIFFTTLINAGDKVNGTTIPSEIGLLTQLVVLSLESNGLTGSIPLSISQLTLLQLLSFEGNNLNGSIPPSISSLTNLELLTFANNAITGIIPSSIANLEKLKLLSFYQNRMKGSIPSSISRLA
ncbi:hypothetical protein MHU86_12004 [Fragilaria crotonensis]|nr:hypothetical protein MHU86_12004 [Fragilaria crotonensis]